MLLVFVPWGQMCLQVEHILKVETRKKGQLWHVPSVLGSVRQLGDVLGSSCIWGCYWHAEDRWGESWEWGEMGIVRGVWEEPKTSVAADNEGDVSQSPQSQSMGCGHNCVSWGKRGWGV